MQRPLYRVIKAHEASFPEAMIATKGDRVHIGKEDPEMSGWYWCRNEKGIEAWVPKTHLTMSEGEVLFNQPYNSIEVTVVSGEVVQYLGESLGWTECLNKEWKYGWVPSEKLLLV